MKHVKLFEEHRVLNDKVVDEVALQSLAEFTKDAKRSILFNYSQNGHGYANHTMRQKAIQHTKDFQRIITALRKITRGKALVITENSYLLATAAEYREGWEAMSFIGKAESVGLKQLDTSLPYILYRVPEKNDIYFIASTDEVWFRMIGPESELLKIRYLQTSTPTNPQPKSEVTKFIAWISEWKTMEKHRGHRLKRFGV